MTLPEQPEHFAWARSAIVAAALVVAALIPVVADRESEPQASQRAAKVEPAVKTPETALRGGRRTCLRMLGKPASVLDVHWPAIRKDANGSGDTAVPMRGGTCWLKWSNGPDSKLRDGSVSKARFYRD